MNNRSFYPVWHPRRRNNALRRRSLLLGLFALLTVFALVQAPQAKAGEAPSWMRAQVNATLPEHDDTTDAVLLYSETIVTVQPNGKIKSLERLAYKILRPNGKVRGMVHVSFDSETRINSIH